MSNAPCGEKSPQGGLWRNTMEESYLWRSGIIQYEMRLIIEGAIALYEGDAVPLLGLANKSEQYEAADAFDSIGTALYGLREHVRNLQKAHRQEVLRECEGM